MYLLDTHIFLGFTIKEPKLKLREQELIEKSLAAGTAYLSLISIWEIAMLASKEKLILTSPCKEWIELAIQKTAIQLLPLDLDIMIESTCLPAEFHGDPADRMIVASARLHNATLISHDKKIIAYGKKGHVLMPK